MAIERLQKFIAECGVASRRRAEELIKNNCVVVNGVPAKIGMNINTETDFVEIDGKEISKSENMIYILLYKPRGYVTTMNDESGRRSVADLVKNINERIYPIGRLDKDSEGLLIMTNDGEFAYALMHPKFKVPKTYRVTVMPGILPAQKQALEKGVRIDSGITAPAKVEVTETDKHRSRLYITITEGKNREIRKMCEQVGLSVKLLKRVSEGGVRIGNVKPGEYRYLTKNEICRLKKAALGEF